MPACHTQVKNGAFARSFFLRHTLSVGVSACRKICFWLKQTSLVTVKDKMKQETINRKQILEQITPLIENTLMRFDFIPVEIEFVKENHRWFIRIYIYSRSRGVTLDDCENITRSLNDFLDELIPCKYYLEVSSPGLERKFKSDKEYLLFRGKNISIKLKEQPEDSSEQIFKANLIDYDEERRTMFVKRLSDEKELTIKLDDIKNSRLYLEEKTKGDKND